MKLLPRVFTALAILVAPATPLFAAGTQEAASEVVTLKWLSHRPPNEAGSVTHQYIEETFDVKLDIWRFSGTGSADYNQELNLKLAAGEIPHLVYLWSAVDVDQYARQGVLSELPQAEIEEKMPYYGRSITEIEPGLWNTGLSQGRRYSIPLYFPLGGDPRQPAYNAAWMEAGGFNAPPTTLEELEEVLDFFSNGDPDGNGRNDTYGYSSVFNQTPVVAFQTVFGAFDILPLQWKEIDGRVVFGMTTERAREAFGVLADWYEKGYIDPEFIVTGWAKYQEDFTSGRVGMFDPQRWDNLFPGRPIPTAFTDAGNDIMVGGAIEGPYGEGALHAWGVYNNFVSFGVELEDDAVRRDKLFEILDALSSDEDVYLRTQFGVEGEHHRIQNGTPVFLPEWSDPTEQQTILGLGDFFNPFKNKSQRMTTFSFPADALEFRNSVARASDWDLLTDKSWEVVVPEMQQYPDLNTLANESFIKFITGEVNLDAGFDAFVAQWRRSGGQAVEDSMNRVFDSIR